MKLAPTPGCYCKTWQTKNLGEVVLELGAGSELDHPYEVFFVVFILKELRRRGFVSIDSKDVSPERMRQLAVGVDWASVELRSGGNDAERGRSLRLSGGRFLDGA